MDVSLAIVLAQPGPGSLAEIGGLAVSLGHRVAAAVRAPERALALARELGADLVVLDEQPSRDACLGAVRRARDRLWAPVVITCRDPEPWFWRAAARAGAGGALARPLQKRQLGACLLTAWQSHWALKRQMARNCDLGEKLRLRKIMGRALARIMDSTGQGMMAAKQCIRIGAMNLGTSPARVAAMVIGGHPLDMLPLTIIPGADKIK